MINKINKLNGKNIKIIKEVCKATWFRNIGRLSRLMPLVVYLFNYIIHLDADVMPVCIWCSHLPICSFIRCSNAVYRMEHMHNLSETILGSKPTGDIFIHLHFFLFSPFSIIQPCLTAFRLTDTFYLLYLMESILKMQTSKRKTNFIGFLTALIVIFMLRLDKQFV